ncbi:MAG: toprim domain-containing protein [Bacteroidia bacterium]|nr:toprim domain-containing protein [Bacteroidia bacterium]
MIEQYPSKLLQDAVEAISSLPGVGSRSALRLALHLLNQPKENVHHFTEAINRLADEVQYCPDCMMISDNGRCSICSDKTRDHNTICVVESVRDVMSIENTGQYRGVYHVLGGIISPINGVGPSDLTIRQLIDRLRNMAAGCQSSADRPAPQDPSHLRWAPPSYVAEGGTDPRTTAAMLPNVEVILALSGDVEGETTSFYIYRQISGFGVKVTSLARGLGFGDDLEYADSLTLGRSIINRHIFKP